MTEDLDKLKKMIKEKGIKTVEDMQKETSEYIKKIPNFKEKYEKVIRARGYVLDKATILEIAFNELILKTGGGFSIDSVKKELKLVTGIKGNVDNMRFKEKASLVKKLIKKTMNKHEEISIPNLLDDFEKFVAIRNIFAHVPINWMAENLEFNDNFHYKPFFKLNPNWKNLPIAFNDFMRIEKGILEAIPNYVRIILLNEKIISTVLFGTDLEGEGH